MCATRTQRGIRCRGRRLQWACLVLPDPMLLLLLWLLWDERQRARIVDWADSSCLIATLRESLMSTVQWRRKARVAITSHAKTAPVPYHGFARIQHQYLLLYHIFVPTCLGSTSPHTPLLAASAKGQTSLAGLASRAALQCDRPVGTRVSLFSGYCPSHFHFSVNQRRNCRLRTRQIQGQCGVGGGEVEICFSFLFPFFFPTLPSLLPEERGVAQLSLKKISSGPNPLTKTDWMVRSFRQRLIHFGRHQAGTTNHAIKSMGKSQQL